MQAITVQDCDAGVARLSLTELHRPQASEKIGGGLLDRSATLVRAGGMLVTVADPPEVRPADGRAVFFVVEPDRSRLADLATRLRDGRLTPVVGAVRPLAEASPAFAPDRRTPGKTIIRVTEDLT
jgi:NADPH:quinone reductase-like Zn-dependent oxidoreductase